jgi:hypothetical protein
MNIFRLGIATLLTLLLTGCAGGAPTSYADRYVAALGHYPGVELQSEAPIDAFLLFFSQAPTSTSANRLYANELYFSDTLFTSERHDEVVSYLDAMHQHAGGLDIVLLGRQIDGADVYLVWRMRFTFTPIRKPIESDSIGITHLRFNERGQIVLQQDFWDSAAGFYGQLPIVGPVLERIGQGLAPDA